MKKFLNDFSTDFRVVDSKIYRHLITKKWFEIDDIRKLFPKAWLKLIKGKKNIGKTLQLQKIMWEHENNRDLGKIAFGRFSRAQMIEIGREMSEANNTDWPFKVKEGRLYSKKDNEYMGKMFYLKGSGMGNNSSLQFKEYAKILVDEYVPDKLDKTFLTTKQQIAQRFIIMVLDVWRNKKDVEVILFANNHDNYDAFAEFFRIDVDADFCYDDDAHILHVNLRDMYIGVEHVKAKGALKYSPELWNFVEHNKAQLNTRMIPFSRLTDTMIDFQFVIAGQVLQFRKKFEFRNIYFTHVSDDLDLQYPAYGMMNIDLVENIYIVELEKDNPLFETIFVLMRTGNLFFTTPRAEALTINLINQGKRASA